MLTHKYFEGKGPPASKLKDIDVETLRSLSYLPYSIAASLENYQFREALAELMNVGRLENKYLTDAEAWKNFKEDPKRVATILNVCLQICANIELQA